MFSGIGFQEMLVIAIVAVILFGRKLPEVARNAGSIYRDFRKQISDIQTTFTEIDVNDTSSNTSEEVFDHEDDYDQPSAPRFEPPPEDED